MIDNTQFPIQRPKLSLELGVPTNGATMLFGPIYLNSNLVV